MDIWKGSVNVPSVGGTTLTLKDLCISTDLQAPSPTTAVTNHLKTYISDSSFSFLSYLSPSRVPFFLAAGPSLHVTTASPSTCDFFRNFFLSALPKTSDVEEETTEQSRIALLLQVHRKTSNGANDDTSNPGDWGITELLVYGAVTYPSTPDPAPTNATPPNSSPDPPLPRPVPIVSVHALPLSSRHNFASHVPIKPEPNQEEARYIAPNPQDVLNPFISRSTKKRRADALDRAVDKKVKKQKSSDALVPLTLMGRSALGGRSVNAGNLLPSPRDSLPDRTGSPEPLVGKKQRSSGTMGSSKLPSAGPKSLQLAASMSVLSDRMPTTRPRSATMKGKSIKKEPIPDAVERSEIENKNRDQLNKIVLEEMKRRGLKDYRKDKDQRAKSVMPPGDDVQEIVIAEDEKELWKKWEQGREEYKCVFHHTVKAAIFSLRNDGFGEAAIFTKRMRSVVDRLLSVFLDDGEENAVDVVRQAIES